MKTKDGFRKFLTYIVFVVIATLFWLILSLNDNIQDDFDVRVTIRNVPDSVTFITDPPSSIHIVVRDRGTILWRTGLFSRPSVELNFRDFASDGVFKVSKSELNAELKDIFGSGANIISSSIESINISYTTQPGRKVPVYVIADFSSEAGKIIYGKPLVTPASVEIFTTRVEMDTISKVFSEKIVKNDLKESTEFRVKLKSIPGVKMKPEYVVVKVKVETLVKRQSTVNINVDNLPEGFDLLLFPSVANVEYYVPMSDFSNSEKVPEVSVNFNDLELGSKKLAPYIGRYSRDMVNVVLLTDSIEYTLVRN